MGSDAINLRDQVAVLRRRWRIVALCTVLGLVVSLGLALLQPAMYRSNTRLEVTPVNVSQAASNGLVMQPAEIATQVEILLSTPVAERVIDSLGLENTTPRQLIKTVMAEPEADTRVINVTAMRPTAVESQKVATAFAEEYLAFRKEQAVIQSREALAVLNDEANRVREEIAAVETKLDNATGAELAQLQSQQQGLVVELTQILGDMAAAGATSPGALGGGGTVIVPATVPTSPAEPQPLKSALLGAFLGLILGVALAFIRDHFDDAIRDESRLRSAVAPRPILGRIPHWANAKSGRLATVMDPASQVSEAYRALSTNIRFLLAVAKTPTDRPRNGLSASQPLTKASTPGSETRSGKVLLVTSPMEAEGKTSLASNLAVVAAGFGLRVILVDADLRRPQLANVFGLGQPPGLSDLLASDDEPEDYLIDVEELRVLSGGSLAPNPAELLASPRMHELLRTLAGQADLVIIDTTPVTRVADALELVSACDLVLMVARHGRTRLRALDEAILKIHQVGGEVSGAVYADVPLRSGEAYGYGHSYTGEEAMVARGPRVRPATERSRSDVVDAPTLH